MTVKNCIKLLKGLDPEDAAAVRDQQKSLVASGVPGADAWTQAAELVMEDVLGERNELAGEIAEKGGFLQVLDIENLLNPASYKGAETTWDEAVKQVRKANAGYPGLSAQLDAKGAEKAGKSPDQWVAEMEKNPPDTSIYKIGYESEEGASASNQMERRTLLKGALSAATVGGVFRLAKGPTNNTTLGRTKPISDEAVDAPLPAAVEKILRADGSLPEALSIMAKEGPAELRVLAAQLSKLIPKGVIQIVVDEKSATIFNNQGYEVEAPHGSVLPRKKGALMTLYTANGRTGMSAGTFIHESMHAAVVGRYHQLSVAMAENNYKLLDIPKPQAIKAMRDFKTLWKEFRREVSRKDIKDTSVLNAYSDPDEFFTRALTDPHVQAFMAARVYKGRTLRERFVDWVKFTLFGFENTGEVPSWLDAATMGANDIIAAMNLDPADFSLNNAIIAKLGEGSASQSAINRPIKTIPSYKSSTKQSDAITLREEKTRLPGKVDIHAIGAYFDKLHKKRYRRKGSFTNKQDIARVKKHMGDEVAYQLTQALTGKGWYDEDVHDAMQLSDQFVPGLANNPTTKQLMTIVSGILSNGNKANGNWAFAIDAMSVFSKTRKMPTHQSNGEIFGRRGANIAKQLTTLGNAIDSIGVDATVEFFMGVHTGREIRAFKKEHGGTDRIEGRVQMDNLFFGARIFGPKVGNFVMSLNGIHGDDVVMDQWATRTMNRHMGRMNDESGTMIDSPREHEREAFTQVVSEIAAEQNLETRDVQAILWYFEQQLFNGLGARSKPESFSDGARTYIGNNGGVQPSQKTGTGVRGSRAAQEVAPDEVQDETGETGNAVSEDKSPYGDLLAATGISGEEAKTQSADTFHVLYEATEVGTIQSGVSQINSHDDMAHLVAGIRKHAQETFIVAVTDDAGNILNVIRHSIGTRDGASVYPIDVVGAIAATKGSTKYWLAHNHPSGIRQPSQADANITKVINKATVGLGVEYQGHVIIGDTGYSDVFLAPMDQPIPAYARRKKVPITERRLKRKSATKGPSIESPGAVIDVIKGLESKTGLLLLDNRNQPAGVLAITTAEMSLLRDGKQVRRILTAVDKSNALAVIGFNRESDGRAALDNLSNYLSNVPGLRVLDMVFEEDGKLATYTERGISTEGSGKGFAMRRQKKPGPARIDQARHRRNVTQWLSKPLKRLQGRVPVIINNKPSEVEGIDIPVDAMGFKYKGKVYLFRDNIRNQKEAIQAIEHESIGHLGLEGVLGHRKFNELIGDVTNIVVEIMMDSTGKLHPEVRNIRNIIRRNYVDAEGKYTLGAREEAREILAHITESKPRLGRLREIYNKVVAWIKEWAAKMGMADPDMAMIESLIGRATDYVTGMPLQQYTGRADTGSDMVTRMRTPLVVAGMGVDGEIYTGNPGEIHMHLADRYNVKFDQLGFADSQGNFLTREEALKVVQEDKPGFEPWDTGDKLDALDYKVRAAPLEDNEKGAAMVRPPPNDEEMDLLNKLGLGKKETLSLGQKLANLRFRDIKETFKTAWARSYEGLFDGLVEIKRKEIESGVGLGQEITYLTPEGVEKKTVDYSTSAYVAARLATGISDMMTHLMNWGSLKWDRGIVGEIEDSRGLLQVFGELGEEHLTDWLVWMAGNRAKGLSLDDRENNLTPDQITEAMGKIGPEGTSKYDLFIRIKKEYNKMNKAQLDFAQEAGLIDPVKRRQWESEWYVPFYRQTEDEGVLGPQTTHGLSHQSAQIRRLMGAEMPTVDLMEGILTNWTKLVDASVKHHALRTMIDNFSDEGKPEDQKLGYITNATMEFKKAMVPTGEFHRLIKENAEFAERLAEWLDLDAQTTSDGIIDAISELDASGLEKVWQIVAPSDPDVVRIQRNGKSEFWRIHVPGLLRATGHMQPKPDRSRLMRAGRAFKNLLTFMVTMSPDFMARNFIRDAAHSWSINKDNMFFGKDAIKGLKHALGEGPVHRAMMAAGASFQGGYMHGTDPEATTKILRRELIKAGYPAGRIDKYLGSLAMTPGKLWSFAEKGLQHYRSVGDKIENASRVATAQAGMDAGKPMAQWLFESKDLMDYSRRGNFAALIAFTDIMPFLNARIQGLDKLGRAAKEDPKIVAGKVAWIAGFSVMLAMMNDDDDDYKQLPDWEKDAYWHIFPPGLTGEKEHIRIPKPFEIGFIAGTMPERMYRAWYSKSQPSEKVIWAFQHGLRETLNINLYPQIVLPVAELKANRHFYFDQPIESLADQNKTSDRRFNRYTSETAIALGDTAMAKWLEISPKQMQHLWNGYMGTLGAYALSGADMLTGPLTGQPTPEETQISDWALVKSFYKGDRKRTTQWQVDFYDRVKEVRQLHGTLRDYIQSNEKEKARAFLKENKGKLAMRKSLQRVQKTFSLLRKRRERILGDDSFTPAEKYQKSQAIQVRINALAKKIEARSREAFSD